MSYWDRVLGNPAPQQPAQPQPGGTWQPPPPAPGYPQPPQAPPQHGYQNPNGWAVDASSRGNDAIAATIREQGFISKPPSWARHQATDRCPECDSASYAQVSGAGKDGQYGGTIRIGGGMTSQGHVVPESRLVFKRCFACGYSTTGAQTNAMLAARTAPTGEYRGAARQTETGGARMQNFYGEDGRLVS